MAAPTRSSSRAGTERRVGFAASAQPDQVVACGPLCAGASPAHSPRLTRGLPRAVGLPAAGFDSFTVSEQASGWRRVRARRTRDFGTFVRRKTRCIDELTGQFAQTTRA